MARSSLILPNERVMVCGKTGSGKSFLTSRYLAGYPNVIALDTKGDSAGAGGLRKFWPHAYDAGLEIPIFTELRELVKFGAGKAIYRPEPAEMNWDYYEAFFRWLYERRHTVGWVDEVYSVTYGQELPPSYLACLTRGRSRGVGMWSCTQRPKNVPNVLFSEAEHHFVFRLLLGGDRKKVSEWAGEEVMSPPPGKFGFWYYNVQADRPILVPDGLLL